MLHRRALLLTAMIAVPALLRAQHPDSTGLQFTTTHRYQYGELDSLPVDSLRTALGFVPGVLPGSRGDLYIRGGTPDGLVTYLDGVPVQPGVRGGGFGTSTGALTPWATGLASASITTGPYGAAFGNGISGLLELRTRSGGDHWAGAVRYSTDELSGKAASFGVNRIEGSIGGPLGPRLRLFAGVFVHGQQSAVSGLDGAAAPIFVPAGVDTTLAVPSAYGDPGADTTYVQVANWAVYRGDCSAFSHSADPGIARNYGATCQGDRIPMSASTPARYQFRLDATPDARTQIWFSALGGRDQARIFDYTLIQDAQAMTAVVNDSRVWTLGVRRGLSPTLGLEAAISFQHDQSENGPLDPGEELSTRDPFGGLLIAPLKLRWNLSNFPVDDQLITNYRDDIANSRRSPYDLSNVAQYSYIDWWRNDAYALQGYAESGGPGGRLSLYSEGRIVGRAAVSWRPTGSTAVTAGVEGTRYDISNYSHMLTTQISSDVWKGRPMAGAAFASGDFALGEGAVLRLGLRYQYFSTDAERPWLLDTVVTNGTFGTYMPFPHTNTYGLNPDQTIATFGGRPLLTFRKDPSHSGFSPSLAVAAPLDAHTRLHVSATRVLQTPDLALTYAGVNTDLQETSWTQVFGTPLGFLDASLAEAGVEHALNSDLAGSITGYFRRDHTRPAVAMASVYDPFFKGAQWIQEYMSLDGGSTVGVEIQLARHTGILTGNVAYAYQHTTYKYPEIIFAPDEGDRPHAVTAVATVALPPGWHQGTSAGTILAGTSATVLFRYASGARDYGCPSPTFVAPGDPPCPSSHPAIVQPVEPARLPAIKTVDLRLSRSIRLGTSTVSIFADVHNLFNFTSYVSALGPFATTSAPLDVGDQWAFDSSAYGSESQRNGVYSAATGSIDLTFGGATDPRTGCGAWQTAAGQPGAPNCVYLIRAEQRFGNGDGIYTVPEQKRASEAQYLLQRGLAAMTDLPRRIRIGMQMTL